MKRVGREKERKKERERERGREGGREDEGDAGATPPKPRWAAVRRSSVSIQVAPLKSGKEAASWI